MAEGTFKTQAFVEYCNPTVCMIHREACGRCECVVLFSDDAQKFAALKDLNQEQQALAAKRQAILDRLEHVRDAVGSAAAAHKSACKAVEKRQKDVGPCLLKAY